MIKKLGVILNGPPGCGKDTIANMLADESNGAFLNSQPITKLQFKDALYEHTARHFQVDLDKYIHFASDRELKDSKSLAGLGGRTPREALIHVSEDIYKPRYGNDYFGKVEANRVRELAGRLGGIINVVYPDGGFPDEVLAVESEYDYLLYIRLHRDGFDFSRDSRNYVYLPDTETRKSFDVNLIDGRPAHTAAFIFSLMEQVSFNGAI